jgi:predicted protein tyrosine phosphatase
LSLIVCPLRLIDTLIQQRKPSHLITLLGQEMIDEHPGVPNGRHLRVHVNDIAEPMEGLIAPNEALVRSILEFGSGWDARRPILIHCWAGISRSSATAYILACDRNPDAAELDIAKYIRQTSPIAHPNPLLVALADDLLGRQGRMVDALRAIGPGAQAFENEPFDVPSRFAATVT